MLPNFGGSYLVWGSCVVFFQAVLFLGYFFSFSILSANRIKKFNLFYFFLSLLPLLFFPGRQFLETKPLSLALPLVFNVFLQLLFTIGPVFFFLSTTSVILQAWLADSDLKESANPYALYAVSNLGSFAALITYPFVFEFLGLGWQILIWRLMYFLLVGLILCAALSIGIKRQNYKVKITLPQEKEDFLRWFFFSAAGVVMFISVTNMITYEIAPIPLLWVVPLCIYLLSFVLNFKSRPLSWPWVTEKFYLTFAWSIVLFFMISMRIFPFVLELIFECFFLFHICMFCQYNLAKFKPLKPDNLPFYYLVIAAGGFTGGAVCTWIMPLITVSVFEYFLGLFFVALALAVGTRREKLGAVNIFLITYICLLLMFWPVFFTYYNVFGVVILLFAFKICYQYLIKNPRAFLVSIAAVIFIAPLIDSKWSSHKYVYESRNYYGIYKVYEDDQKYTLMNGTTIHGAQFIGQRQNEPITYYHKFTPVGELLDSPKMDFKNIGLIGLGTGAIIAYSKENQFIDCYEIDPDMKFIASRLFTYLKNAKGTVNIIFGDARIKIRESPGALYDIIILDAFSGDSVPVHLLTTDAIEEYRRHLKEGGIILFHISNRYLDFVPVLFSNANYLNAYGCFKDNESGPDENFFSSSWFAISWDLSTHIKLLKDFNWMGFNPKYRLARPWTDKYSNMISIMRMEGFFYSLRHFKPFYW